MVIAAPFSHRGDTLTETAELSLILTVDTFSSQRGIHILCQSPHTISPYVVNGNFSFFYTNCVCNTLSCISIHASILYYSNMYQFPHFLTLPISLPLLHHPPPLLALDLFPPPLLSFLVCRAWLGVSTTSRQLATAAGQTVTPSPSRPPFNPPCLLQDTEFPHSLHSLDTGPPKAFNTLYASGLQPEFLHC